MSLADSPSVSSAPQDGIHTRADNELPVNETVDQAADEWQALIDGTLIEWGRDPEQIADEDLDPPSAGVVRKAILLAQARQRSGQPAPSRVVPDADGGIVFEHRSGSVVETLHVWDDESVEYYRLERGRVVERYSI